MKDYTLRIPENNAKASALLAYLKTLDFVTLTNTTDWWDDLSSEAKKSIERGIKQADENKLSTHKLARKKIDIFFKENE